MNKPVNKKRCGGCDFFIGLHYHCNGITFGVCHCDFRIDSSDEVCKLWKGKKYSKKDRKKFKENKI